MWALLSWRRGGAAQSRLLDGACNEAFTLRFGDEFLEPGHGLSAALRNRDREMFDAPLAVQHSRTGHAIGHLEETRLVGRERIDLMRRQHLDGALHRGSG